MILTDTHCHLDFNKFEHDRPEVIQRAREAGVRHILIPGLDLASSLAALRVAESDDCLHAAVGFHPTEVEKLTHSSLDQIKGLAANQKVVAIGEIGLDYYWVRGREKHLQQCEALKEQLGLAEELNLPVILHSREKDDLEHGECAQDLIEILEDWQVRLRSGNEALAARPGVLHSFSGSLETAMRAISLNFYIGVTGPVTFKNAQRRREVISQLPLDRLLIETDAPFLAPVPHRGQRNEPAFVCHIADKIGEIHSKNPAEIAAITSANASRLFAWGD
jgi:TatD DNase family protein